MTSESIERVLERGDIELSNGEKLGLKLELGLECWRRSICLSCKETWKKEHLCITQAAANLCVLQVQATTAHDFPITRVTHLRV